MNRDEVWRTTDAERSSVADLLDHLSPEEWEKPSLCAGWRARDVAAHLTLAQMGVLTATREVLRAGGNFNVMIRDSARRQAALPVEEYSRRLRGMVGSRRKAPGVTHLEPLIDILVHGQDIAIPLGRTRTMPVEAAATAATRVWTTSWPFQARRKLRGLQLVATDVSWTVGQGPRVEGPISAILLLLTGRGAALARLSGSGANELPARLSSLDHDGG
jgi:uncharacterized protein (TIGR03083 family)